METILRGRRLGRTRNRRGRGRPRLAARVARPGVAKSLMLIDGSRRAALRDQERAGAKDRLVMPIFDQTRALARATVARGAEDRLATLLDRAGNPAAWTVERIMGPRARR